MGSLKGNWSGWPRCSEAGAAAARFWSGTLQLCFTQGVKKSLNNQHCPSGKKEIEHLPHRFFLWDWYHLKPLWVKQSPCTYFFLVGPQLLHHINTAHNCHVSIQTVFLIKAEYIKLGSEVYSTLLWYAGLCLKHYLAHSFFKFLKKSSVYYFYLCSTSNITNKYKS